MLTVIKNRKCAQFVTLYMVFYINITYCCKKYANNANSTNHGLTYIYINANKMRDISTVEMGKERHEITRRIGK